MIGDREVRIGELAAGFAAGRSTPGIECGIREPDCEVATPLESCLVRPLDCLSFGDGTTTARFTPVLVSGGLSFSSVKVAEGYSCGVTTEGSAYCWGWNEYGRLGDGTTTGSGYCWGSNGDGQLGDGTTTDRHIPGSVYSQGNHPVGSTVG